MELSSTSSAILGLLAERPMSGYDMKRMADHSVRHFWAISYGQIYPELKRLVGAGLVEVEAAPRGTRERHVYRLTDEGRQRLQDWLANRVPAPIEIRDEMLLKLFFADELPVAERLALLRVMRARHEATAAGLRSLEEHVQAKHDRHAMHGEVLRYGIGLHTWCAQWCADLEAKLAGGTE